MWWAWFPGLSRRFGQVLPGGLKLFLLMVLQMPDKNSIPGSPNAALDELMSIVSSNEPDWNAVFDGRQGPLLISFVNPYSVCVATKNSKYLEDLKMFDHVFADGMLLAKVTEVARRRVVKRLSFDGNSIAPGLFKLWAQRNWRVVLVGGVAGVAEQAASVFKNAFNVNVVSARSGFFDGNDELSAYCQELVALQPDVIVCGMGAPYQERFLLAAVEAGWQGVGVTCGGYFDQAASAAGVSYYPEWVERMNFRAIYRLFCEPRRLGKRYFIDYIPFYLSSLRVIF